MRRVRAATRQALAAFLLTIHLACTSWHTESVTPAELVERDHPDQVRVTTTAGDQVVLSHPVVIGDSLVEETAKEGAPATLPLQDVSRIATRQVSPGKTLGLAAGVTLVGLGVGAVIALASWDGITFGY
jgi:hypothetical protein